MLYERYNTVYNCICTWYNTNDNSITNESKNISIDNNSISTL